MEISPQVPAGRHLVETYGDGGFRIGGVAHRGSVLVMPERTLAWPVARVEDIAFASFAALLPFAADIQVLLLGCGKRIQLVPSALRAELRQVGMVLELMDTGAACRTYNVLAAEDRRVAAALIAVT
jgi:uncharacterized protein